MILSKKIKLKLYMQIDFKFQMYLQLISRTGAA